MLQRRKTKRPNALQTRSQWVCFEEQNTIITTRMECS